MCVDNGGETGHGDLRFQTPVVGDEGRLNRTAQGVNPVGQHLSEKDPLPLRGRFFSGCRGKSIALVIQVALGGSVPLVTLHPDAPNLPTSEEFIEPRPQPPRDVLTRFSGVPTGPAKGSP